MIETIAAIIGGLVVTVLVVAAATRKRREMQRHPAPTFVFADLAGYTALTDGAATRRRLGLRASSGARCARSAASTAPGRSSRWATA